MMMNRWLALLGVQAAVMVVVSLTSGPAAGQSPTTAPTTQSAAAKTWTPPRTPWGEADLQGVWRYEGLTPLERPESKKSLSPERVGSSARQTPIPPGREVLTDAEVAQLQRAENERVSQRAAGAEGDHPELSGIEGNAYNNIWQDTGRPKKASRRTSLIVDPPDGKIPYTPEMLKRKTAQELIHAGIYPTRFFHQSWLDFDTEDRCLTHGVPGALLGGTSGAVNMIVQSPGYVVILQEAINDRRTIPTDGRPHGDIRGWRGDSVGHWEGNTLVVDTINFADKSHYRWDSGAIWRMATDTMHLVERFTRVDADTMDYEFTIEDPKKFTRPLKVVVPITNLPVAMIEYACQEGNYAAIHALSENRNLEKAAAKGAKKGQK
jgi:hypothetical protein